ncbi:MAG: ribulose-phosphate 3-epimerase, partial [Firmicutes bacterium]|nr:ribulose-phosphate 3-epimerase [Bacillota bacterium]
MKICPSILAADFTKLGEEIRRVANADYIHIDIMDGHYVPNLSFGYPIAAAAKQAADLPLDVHLMVANPDQYISDLQILKPEYLTVHYEACTHLQRTLSSIREAGMKAGVALNPHTPISGLKYIMDDLDLILIMTVNPGFGGQSFIPKMLDKI